MASPSIATSFSCAASSSNAMAYAVRLQEHAAPISAVVISCSGPAGLA